jgi:hypothetical protein
MKNIYLCLVVLFIVQSAFCQVDVVNADPDRIYMTNMRNGLMGVEYTDPFSGYNGSHYFNDWTHGEILLANGEIINGLYLRYESYQDQLLWQTKDHIPCIICKECIAGFNLFDIYDNITASFVLKKNIRLPLENDSANCFFQTLVEGELCLYALRKVARLSDFSMLVDDTRYFIFNKDQYIRIRLRSHDLLNVPFIDRSKIKSILKSNRIKLRNDEQALVRAINMYNN